MPCFHALLFAYACAYHAPRPPAAPAEVSGVWDVVEVAVDRQSNNMELAVFPQDPLLMFRTLTISNGTVSFDDERTLQCQQTKWLRKGTSWAALFANGFLRNTTGGRSPRPKPGDYGLSVPANSATSAFPLCAGTKTGKSWWREPWLALLSRDKIVLKYDPQVLLVLRRRAPSAQPTASFDCSAARTDAERTVCGDHRLASWDRSVALAYREALDRAQRSDNHARLSEELKESQRKYLAARDACKANVECVDEAQWRRVDELRQEAYR